MKHIKKSEEENMELSEQTKKDIETARKEIKAGKFATLEQVKKELDIQKPKMKELWYNEKDEIWEHVSELRPEPKEKLIRCEICNIEYSKTKPCYKEAVLMRAKDLGSFGEFMGENYWYWFCPKHGRHDNPNCV